MPKRTGKFQFRLTPEERDIILLAAERKGMTASDFVRFVSLEMARAIATDKTPEETFYAVLMATGRLSPEVVLYSATADYTSLQAKQGKGESKEGESERKDET